ncbi:MAG: hypothetical protein A2Y62_07725 [Candidatus Fischerbacteria bacterium RBG_13_37_8]|uniref:Uncharacterized protein n=1 Tax=Candidatus Fischerbacteria bacterium RBG_13_37_8 TaxID=1817863 RepID=A0A1F5V935_9BACT|nr:MAG: hypothetical protein A2Y62_07725 [Candidatus Fischerbacteria bacterium RBG_13_37_8]
MCIGNSQGPHIRGEAFNSYGDAQVKVFYSPTLNGNYSLVNTIDVVYPYFFFITAKGEPGGYQTGHYKFQIVAEGRDNYAHVCFAQCRPS